MVDIYIGDLRIKKDHRDIKLGSIDKPHVTVQELLTFLETTFDRMKKYDEGYDQTAVLISQLHDEVKEGRGDCKLHTDKAIILGHRQEGAAVVGNTSDPKNKRGIDSSLINDAYIPDGGIIPSSDDDDRPLSPRSAAGRAKIPPSRLK